MANLLTIGTHSSETVHVVPNRNNEETGGIRNTRQEPLQPHQNNSTYFLKDTQPCSGLCFSVKLAYRMVIIVETKVNLAC